MDPDLALKVFWQFAVDDDGREPYIPSAFLLAASRELHLFPRAARIHQFCHVTRLPHHNEVRFDAFMDLYRQLYREASETTPAVTAVQVHQFVASVASPGDRWASRQAVESALKMSSAALSTTDVEAILDVLDPSRSGAVDLERLTRILQSPHGDTATVESPPSLSSSRLPLRTLSTSPSPLRSTSPQPLVDPPRRPHLESNARPSSSTVDGNLALRSKRRSSRLARRHRRPSAEQRWVDEDTALATASHTNARTANIAQRSDHASWAPNDRVRRSRCGQRLPPSTAAAPPSLSQSAVPGSTRYSRRTFSDGTDGVSITVDPCSSPEPTTTVRARGTLGEPHDPFDANVETTRIVVSPHDTQPDSRTHSAHSRDHGGASKPSRSCPDSVTSTPRVSLRGRTKQRAKACDCCVAS